MKTQNLINSLFAVVFTCIGITAVAQPSWTVNPNMYDYSMTVTGKIVIDGVVSVDQNDVISAFIGGECRGVVNIKYQSTLKDYFVFLMIYSNNPTGTISFKVFDASENKEFDVGSTISFSVNGIVGSVSSPHEFSVVTKIYEAKILTFSISDQEGSTSISFSNVYLTQKITGDLGFVIPIFTLSEGAKAYVNDVLQVSGGSYHSFVNSIQYKIVPQIGNPAYYWVTISKAADTSTKILLSNSTVTENKDSVLVGVLTAQSDVLGDNYAFSFADISGTDNQLFYLAGDKLYVKKAFNYELDAQCKVNIKVANNNGISKENTFVVDVINRNDPPTGLSLSAKTISESTAINKLVARFSVQDEDVGDKHRYSLKSGNGINDEGNTFFTIKNDSLVLKEQISKLGKESFKILVSVSDSSGASITKEFVFQVVDINNPPQVISTPVAYAVQNQVYVYQVSVQDKEGDKVTVSFEGLPKWLTYNENTKLLSGVPVNDNVGDIQFKIKVSDGTKETVQTVVISVLNVNDPPEIKQIPGTQYFYTSKENKIILPGNMITDPDKGDKLTFQLSTENNSALPNWMIFDPVTMSISGTPPRGEKSVYNLKLTATDGAGLKEYLIFKLEVEISTALNDQKADFNFRIFPNPVQNSLYIDVPIGDDAIISISNIAGQTIKTLELSPGLAKEIPVNGIQTGIYVVRIQQGEFEKIQKIVKQ